MDVLTAILNRRSIRSFLNKSIPPEIISSLKDALLWAPSAGNLQSRRFYFVRNQEIKHRLAIAAYEQYFIEEAPVVVVGCSDASIAARYGTRGVNLYSIQDVSASIENLMLLAHSFGIGSVWVGAFNELETSLILDLPQNLRPIAIIPLGYPHETAYPPDRPPTNTIIKDID